MAELDSLEGHPRLADGAIRQRLSRLDDLLDRIEQVPGPTADAAIEAVQTLTEVYGEALARAVGAGGPSLVERLHDDELLSHLLVLHDLDTDPVERRVERALTVMRAEIESQGGHVELLDVHDGVAHIRLSGGGCKSCSSSDDLERAVRDSILALAPELIAVQSVPDEATSPTIIPVEALLHRPATVGGTA